MSPLKSIETFLINTDIYLEKSNVFNRNAATSTFLEYLKRLSVEKHEGMKVYPHTPHTFLNEFPTSSSDVI